MKLKSKVITFLPFLAAFLFFFNPNIIVIDFLPDFIGYIILCAALIPLSDLNETIGEAVKGFQKMIIVDASKFLAILWIFGVGTVDEGEKTASMLLWTFVFFVLEMLFAVPAYLKLFGGLLELANFHENTAIHGSRVKKNGTYKKRNYTEKIRSFTVFFVALKGLMAFLPELAEFGNTSYDESSGFVQIYEYIGLLRGMAFIPVLVIGIVWLVKISRYFLRIKKDAVLCEGLSKTYDEKVAGKVGIFAQRYIKTGFFILAAGALLTIDFRLQMEYIFNLIPDVFSAVVLVGFVIYMYKRILVCKKTMAAVSFGYLAVSVFLFWAEKNFYSEHTYLSVLRDAEGSKAYWLMVGAVAVQAVFFIAFVLLAARNIKHIITEHTGFIGGSELHAEVEHRQREVLHKELSRPLVYVAISAVVYAAADVINALQAFLYAYYEADFGYLSAVNIVVGIIFLALLLKTMGEVKDAVKTKYMLE